ncbi:MAG: hypothetical protein OXC63_16245 [Aestuariivita sp.]|nr:hypothetical protein [Aestuariivita sp.]MCY4346498.1 hypothetical protein [Aestuariivita sp.]
MSVSQPLSNELSKWLGSPPPIAIRAKQLLILGVIGPAPCLCPDMIHMGPFKKHDQTAWTESALPQSVCVNDALIIGSIGNILNFVIALVERVASIAIPSSCWIERIYPATHP